MPRASSTAASTTAAAWSRPGTRWSSGSAGSQRTARPATATARPPAARLRRWQARERVRSRRWIVLRSEARAAATRGVPGLAARWRSAGCRSVVDSRATALVAGALDGLAVKDHHRWAQLRKSFHTRRCLVGSRRPARRTRSPCRPRRGEPDVGAGALAPVTLRSAVWPRKTASACRAAGRRDRRAFAGEGGRGLVGRASSPSTTAADGEQTGARADYPASLGGTVGRKTRSWTSRTRCVGSTNVDPGDRKVLR